MKQIFKLLPVASALVILLCANAERSNLLPHYTSDVAICDDGSILLAHKGTTQVQMLSAEGELLYKWILREPATGVAVRGNRAYITSSLGEGCLVCVSLDGEREFIYRTYTGMGACAPTISADGSKVWVCNRYKATVSLVDAASGEVLGELPVRREPCDAVLSVDGRRLYVANFLPQQRADVDYVAAEVSVIDCDNMQVESHIKLVNGSNALRGIALSADGRYLFVTHNLGRYQVPTSQLQQGWMNTNAMSVISTADNRLVGAVALDESDRGAGGVWDIACNEKYIVTSHSGIHEVSIIDYPAFVERLEAYEDYSKMDYDLYFMREIRHRVPIVGNGPRNMELRGDKLFLPTYFSDTLNVVDVVSRKVDFLAYNPDRVETSIDRGERAFNDAALCYQNWQSCNGCHPNEGRTDGMNWDLMNDGIGNPKNCKSMLLAFDTPKCMISGIRDSAGLAVRAGYKFIQFCDIPEDLAQCVDDYIRSLRPLPSPYLVDGKLSAKAEAGRKVYEREGCANCHSGQYYTDMQMHRIGEDIEFEQGWDTPTLVEVWRTAPYLFDGRAATMFDLFYEHKHGIEGKISRKDAEALAEYVNSL